MDGVDVVHPFVFLVVIRNDNARWIPLYFIGKYKFPDHKDQSSDQFKSFLKIESVQIA